MKRTPVHIEYRLPSGRSVHREGPWKWLWVLVSWPLFVATTITLTFYGYPDLLSAVAALTSFAAVTMLVFVGLTILVPTDVRLTLDGDTLLVEDKAPQHRYGAKVISGLHLIELSNRETHDLRGCRGVLLERDWLGPYLRLVYDDGNEYLRVAGSVEEIAAWVRDGVEGTTARTDPQSARPARQ